MAWKRRPKLHVKMNRWIKHNLGGFKGKKRNKKGTKEGML